MNILMPSAGRKYLLAGMLREALDARGGRLFASDASPFASGLVPAHEKVDLPRFDAPDFWSAASALLAQKAIDAVIPVRDAELAGWAEAFEAGRIKTRVFASPSSTLLTCYDKWELIKLATRFNIPCPRTIPALPGSAPPEEDFYPVVVKPRSGAGARGVAIAHSRPMLEALLLEAEGEVLIQRLVEGVEFTVDCYATAEGALKAAVVRKRVAVVGGQSDVGQTVYDEELTSLCRRLASQLKFRGPINIQFIRGREGPQLIDVNPRFAGAVAISRAAGANLAEWTVADLYGEAPVFPESYSLVTWLGYADGVVRKT